MITQSHITKMLKVGGVKKHKIFQVKEKRKKLNLVAYHRNDLVAHAVRHALTIINNGSVQIQKSSEEDPILETASDLE